MTLLYKKIPTIVLAVIVAAALTLMPGTWQQSSYAATYNGNYEVSIESTSGFYSGLPGTTLQLKADLYQDFGYGENLVSQADVDYLWELDEGDELYCTIRPGKQDPNTAVIKFKDLQGEEEAYIGVKVTVFAEGKAQTSDYVILINSGDFTRVYPSDLDREYLLVGESVTIFPSVVHYTIDTPDGVLIDDATFEWDYDPEEVEITKDPDLCKYTIKRLGDDETDIFLTASWMEPGATEPTEDYAYYWLGTVSSDLNEYSVWLPEDEDYDWRTFLDEGEAYSLDNVSVTTGDYVLDPAAYELVVDKYEYNPTTGEETYTPWDQPLTTGDDGSAVFRIKAKAVGAGYSGETEDYPAYLFLYSRTCLAEYGPDIDFNQNYLKWIDEDPWEQYEVKPGTILTPTVAIDGKELIEGTDYKAVYINKTTGEALDEFPTEAGVYIYKVTGLTPYYGVNEMTQIKVGYSNTIKASGKTVTAKAKKKTTIKASKAFKVTGAKGTVTYEDYTWHSKIDVASNGKITVKKGLKKGKTYKIKVLVTDDGGENYLSSSKFVTVKIKIK